MAGTAPPTRRHSYVQSGTLTPEAKLCCPSQDSHPSLCLLYPSTPMLYPPSLISSSYPSSSGSFPPPRFILFLSSSIFSSPSSSSPSCFELFFLSVLLHLHLFLLLSRLPLGWALSPGLVFTLVPSIVLVHRGDEGPPECPEEAEEAFLLPLLLLLFLRHPPPSSRPLLDASGCRKKAKDAPPKIDPRSSSALPPSSVLLALQRSRARR